MPALSLLTLEVFRFLGVFLGSFLPYFLGYFLGFFGCFFSFSLPLDLLLGVGGLKSSFSSSLELQESMNVEYFKLKNIQYVNDLGVLICYNWQNSKVLF